MVVIAWQQHYVVCVLNKYLVSHCHTTCQTGSITGKYFVCARGYLRTTSPSTVLAGSRCLLLQALLSTRLPRLCPLTTSLFSLLYSQLLSSVTPSLASPHLSSHRRLGATGAHHPNSKRSGTLLGLRVLSHAASSGLVTRVTWSIGRSIIGQRVHRNGGRSAVAVSNWMWHVSNGTLFHAIPLTNAWQHPPEMQHNLYSSHAFYFTFLSLIFSFIGNGHICS